MTGPILENELALRLSADRQRDEGDVDNTVTGNPSNYYNSDVLRAKLLWEPDSINGLSALLSHTYGDVAIGLDDVPLDTVRQRTVDYNRDPRWHGLTNITSAEIGRAVQGAAFSVPRPMRSTRNSHGTMRSPCAHNGCKNVPC